jgi:hypothetical protein
MKEKSENQVALNSYWAKNTQKRRKVLHCILLLSLNARLLVI